jgi:cytochrome c
MRYDLTAGSKEESMMSTKTFMGTALTIAGLCVAATAAERGTPAEAKAMLQKAVAHYKAVGRQQALADFNVKKAPFGDRDLYVFCLGPDHIEVANGGFPSYVGTSADNIKDANGKALGKALWETGSKGEGSVAYQDGAQGELRPEGR